MALFACSINASLVTESGVRERHAALPVEAASEFEAEGIALAVARKICRISEGWSDHIACVISIEVPFTIEDARLAEAEFEEAN